MAFFGLFGNYDKPGPGVPKDEPPKPGFVRFFTILARKFSKLVQLNLVFLLPALAAFVVAVGLFAAGMLFFPNHLMMQLTSADGSPVLLDLWNLFVLPFPLVLLSPFMAGMAFVTRNFSREEHAFVWSDFWSSVKGNWRYFLLNGFLCYLAYVILSISLSYYYSRASQEPFYYLPFSLCTAIAVLFIFAQYYLPVIFVTFDLKFWHAYRNACILALAGLGRNLLLTAILGAAGYLAFSVIPVTPVSVTVFLLLLVLLLFSFFAFLINFTVYPLIDRFLIQPYQQKLAEQEENILAK